MSTNGYVGVVNRDGTVNYVYNHFDSYVKGGLGDFLKKKVKTIQQARKLIEKGDASSLETGDYYNEKDSGVKKAPSLNEFVEVGSLSPVEYLYYFKNGKWFIVHYGLVVPLQYAKEY